jgi:hypothetical protein
MSDDPALAAVFRATAAVTGEPNLVGFDFIDLRLVLIRRAAVFGEGEAAGPDPDTPGRAQGLLSPR